MDPSLKRTVLADIRSILVHPNCCQRYFCMNWPVEKPSRHVGLSVVYMLATSISFLVHLTYIVPEFGSGLFLITISALFVLMQSLFVLVTLRDPGYLSTDQVIQSLKLKSMQTDVTDGYVSAARYLDNKTHSSVSK